MPRVRCAWPRWVLGLGSCAIAVGSAPALRAQSQAPEGSEPAALQASPPPAGGGDEEVLFDPELEGVPVAGETIEDPEIEGAPVAGESTPLAQNGDVRVVLHSRAGVDLAWQAPREDVFEAVQLALFEATVRRSDRLQFAVGLRARHLYARREHATADAAAGRFELDVTPMAAYGDVRAADGVHLRLGYQTLHLGRFDVVGASNVLNAYDMRSGPATLPEASDIAQPAARLDWDVASWLSLRAIYLPFLQPHLVRPFEGDYALAPGQQSLIQTIYDALPEDTPMLADDIRALLRDSLSRAGQAELAQSAFDAFAPEPSFKKPQAALRANARGAAGEVGLTLAMARERLPALVLSERFLTLLEEEETNPAAFLEDGRPVRVTYDDFGLLAVDGALPWGPVLLGAELAYQRGRTLLAERDSVGWWSDESDLLQLSVRGEWVEDRWVVVLEAFESYALNAPSRADSRYLYLYQGRHLFGAAAFAAYSVGDRDATLELGAVALNGGNLVIAPRLELRAYEQLFFELGGFVVEGEAASGPGMPGSLAGTYDNTDQVYLGVRWLP